MRHPSRVFWIVAVTTLLLDQLSKALVRVLWSSTFAPYPLDAFVAEFVNPLFHPAESLSVIGESLRITYVLNTGAAFGMFPGYQPLFIATSIIVLVVVAVYWRRTRPSAWPLVIALALVSGGAVGNLIDRAMIGKVTDFFDIAVVDFPVFNIADSAIFIGVWMLVFWLLFGPAEPADVEPGPSGTESVEVPGSVCESESAQDEASR